MLFIIIIIFLIILFKQTGEIKSLQHDNKIYHDIVSTLGVGFCSVDLKKRSEVISFKGVHSLNELYDFVENSDELRSACASASNSYKVFSLILKIKGTDRYVKCRGKSTLDNNGSNLVGLILIFEDVSESIRLSTTSQIHAKHILENKQYYVNILNHSPYLIWEHNNNSEVKYANKLYLKHFGDLCINMQHCGNTYKRLSINGEVRVFSITSIENNHSSINFAHDVTELHKAQDQISKLYNSRKNIVMCLKTPIAFYDKNMKLKLYNNAFVNLWGLEQRWLNKQPLYLEIWDNLYEDGKVLKNDFLYNTELFANIIEPHHSIIHLTNSTDVHVTIIPGVGRSLWFMYETITEQLR